MPPFSTVWHINKGLFFTFFPVFPVAAIGSIVKNNTSLGHVDHFADLTLLLLSLSRVVVKVVFSNKLDLTRCFHAMKKK